MGEQDSAMKPDSMDLEKLRAETFSNQCVLLGKHVNTQTMMVSLPADTRVALYQALTTTWGPHRKSKFYHFRSQPTSWHTCERFPMLLLGRLSVPQLHECTASVYQYELQTPTHVT